MWLNTLDSGHADSDGYEARAIELVCISVTTQLIRTLEVSAPPSPTIHCCASRRLLPYTVKACGFTIFSNSVWANHDSPRFASFSAIPVHVQLTSLSRLGGPINKFRGFPAKSGFPELDVISLKRILTKDEKQYYLRRDWVITWWRFFPSSF